MLHYSSRRKPQRQLSRPPSTAYPRRNTLSTVNNSSTTTSSGDESDIIIERLTSRLTNGLGARNGKTTDGPMSSGEPESGTETPTGEFNRKL